ncbi:MAG: SPASM domain-containing protein [bacterium]|nr:SPASM domain-containing protein [bacterium]
MKCSKKALIPEPVPAIWVKMAAVINRISKGGGLIKLPQKYINDKEVNDVKLKWSRFVFWIEYENSDKIIARNTLTTSTVRLTGRLKREIDEITNNGQSNITGSYLGDYINELVKMEMLVPAELNEKLKYKELFHKARLDDKTFGIYLVLTRNCQLACPYCFERGIEKHKSMSIQIADEIVNWCDAYLGNHAGCNKLRVVLYGGEPLLNKKTIRFILPKLHTIAKQKNLALELGIMTNGEFFDKEIASFLNGCNLDRVQITLDGYGKVHDLRRFRKDGKGTFDKISKNILSSINQGFVKKIHLRVNFDRQNVDLIPQLFDFLAENKLQDKIEFSFGIVAPTICGDMGKRAPDSYLNEFGLSFSESADKYLWLCKEAKKRGFVIPQEYLVGPWCTARAINSATIEPDGALLKCISTVGRDGFSFGNIDSTANTDDAKFMDFSYLDKCLSEDCPFVPICGGGCRFDAYVTIGSLLEPYCRRELVEKINKGLVKLNFE